MGLIIHKYKRKAVVAGFDEWDGNPVVEIPSTTPEGIPITDIRDFAFKNSKIRAVITPDTLVTVGNHAFYGCTELRSITCHNGLSLGFTSIGEGAFFECCSLSGTLRLDNDVEIGPGAFEGTALTHVVFSGSHVKLGAKAFRNCKFLETVTAHEGLTSIPTECFSNSPLLRSADLVRVRSISSRAFQNCQSLSSFPSSKNLRQLAPDAFDGCPFSCKIQSSPEPTDEEPPEFDILNILNRLQDFEDSPLMRFNIHAESAEKTFPSVLRVKGRFQRSAADYRKYIFVAANSDLKDSSLTVSCHSRYNSLLYYLSNNSIPVTVRLRKAVADYEVMDMSLLGSTTKLSSDFFDEVLYRLSGWKSRHKARHTFRLDEASLFLELLDETLPAFVKDGIRKELRVIDSAASEPKKHALAALDMFLNLDFAPQQALEIPDLETVSKELDKRIGGNKAAKNMFLAQAARMKHSKSPPETLLLVGPPGTGKTGLTEAYIAAFGKDFPLVRFDLSSLDDSESAGLCGSSRHWSNAEAGSFLRSFYAENNKLWGACFFDELDKSSKTIQNAILNLVERKYFESFLEQTITFDNVIFILAANSLEGLTPALLSRVRVVFLQGYSREEKRSIVEDIVLPAIHRENELNPGFCLDHDGTEVLLDAFADSSGIREIKKALTGRFLDNYYLELEAGLIQHKRVFTPDDVRRILGPLKAKSEPMSCPGSASFLYIDYNGMVRKGTVQATITPFSMIPGDVKILNASGPQGDHVKIAIEAVKNNHELDISIASVTIAFREPVMSFHRNVVGLPTYLAVLSAMKQENINQRAICLGAGVDIFGSCFIDLDEPLTSVIKKASDLGTSILLGPVGMTRQTCGMDLATTPLIIETNECNAIYNIMTQ